MFHGPSADGQVIVAGVTGDKDPGYGSTSKMLAESAICLVHDETGTAGGIWTPAPAMGGHLVKRLKEKAGLTFEVENKLETTLTRLAACVAFNRAASIVWAWAIATPSNATPSASMPP